MALLDLTSLPPALRATLDRHFTDDEARRRALLAPWCDDGFRSVWPDLMPAWAGTSGSAKDARVRTQREAFFGLRLVEGRHAQAHPGRSIFDPSLPFFATPLAQPATRLVSPWPDAFSDAEYWAIVMQLYDGDEPAARGQLAGVAQRLRGDGGLWSRWRQAARRERELAELVYRRRAFLAGDYA